MLCTGQTPEPGIKFRGCRQRIKHFVAKRLPQTHLDCRDITCLTTSRLFPHPPNLTKGRFLAECKGNNRSDCKHRFGPRERLYYAA